MRLESRSPITTYSSNQSLSLLLILLYLTSNHYGQHVQDSNGEAGFLLSIFPLRRLSTMPGFLFLSGTVFIRYPVEIQIYVFVR